MHDRPDSVIVGGGTMGSGIAAALLFSGHSVRLVEPDTSRHAAIIVRISKSLTRGAERACRPVDPAEMLTRLSIGARCEPLESVTLAIEAVPEQMVLKREVATTMAAAYPAALLATNTSSLSIDAIAPEACRQRFLGMHFFNPVGASQLVEIVSGTTTATATIERARAIVTELGKTAIVVRDSPGFASSRLGLALGLEAIRMVDEGVAEPDDIDAAMTLGYKHPIGPLRLTDLVGLDVRLAIAEHLAETLGPRFEPPRLLRAMVADGRLGQKTGSGFYEWPQ
jgi:3-hydroxybutyryl-CoA dehydrogenase